MLVVGYFEMLWESQMSRTEIKYYHQQYLHKNPNGYCGLLVTAVECSIWTNLVF